MDAKNENTIKDFTDLKVWKEGHKLVLMVYSMSKYFPKEETYALADQIKRAVVSVTSNVAKGFGRRGYKEKIQFYYMAQGSLIELKNQLIIARDLKYISFDKFDSVTEQANITHQLLQGLITKSKSFLASKS